MDYIFYGITMLTKKGQRLYLSCSSKKTKDPNRMLMEWSFDIEKACLWDSDQDCNKFATDYFKEFNNYEIRQINVGRNSMKTYLVKESLV